MSLNMYLGEVHTQTQDMNAVCTATIQGMEQVIQSIDAFAIDTVLQGQTYSSAKAFFVQTFRPLAQGIIYLCEELIHQNDAFPSQFQSQVASTDVIEQEILEQIREIDRMKASMEAISQAMPMPSMDAMANLFTVMRHKLQEKLNHLYEFNQASSNNYATALQLATSIAQGLAEVQSGKGFSPASGTFSTQVLNMEWTTSIQAIEEDRKRQADKSIEEDAMCGKLSSEEKGFDGKKLARDIAGEISGEYDVRRAWDGIDPSTGEKLSTWERVFAGGMAVAGLTPVGKIAKVGKGVKMTANAVEAANTIKKADRASDIKKYATSIDHQVTEIEKANLPPWIGDSFTDGVFRTVKTNEEVTLYRTFGHSADAGGGFATTVPAQNRIQAKLDTALLPEWKNSRMYEATIKVPEGETLNLGKVAEQYTMSGTTLKGGGDQVLLPQNWPLEWISDVRKVPNK
ncbi:pre-toxin TG domain-containing protein [Bacillus sp. GMa5/1]|uniref:pre-toxin TG domain-containing protein n=1 Tax=Bacillus sp. GMa5/1 TaxID=3418496 RepID=UPI003CF62C56